jgi:enoyl-CoA hydratase
MSSVLHVSRQDGVATVRIDRPPANAVDPALIEDLLDALSSLATDVSTRCVVVTGTGRFFVAGADIAVMRDLSVDNHVKMRRWIEVQRLIETMPKPAIAAMNGHALGGGAELALATDLRVLADSATFGFPEMQLGLFPGAGGSQRLPRLVGSHRAKRLMIDAQRLSAEAALDYGLVDVVVPDASFGRTVDELAHRYAAMPTAAIGLLKRAVFDGYGRPLDEALEREQEAVMKLISTQDAAEGLQAFLDKRAPRFTGR